jgi:hypothetical protein
MKISKKANSDGTYNLYQTKITKDPKTSTLIKEKKCVAENVIADDLNNTILSKYEEYGKTTMRAEEDSFTPILTTENGAEKVEFPQNVQGVYLEIKAEKSDFRRTTVLPNKALKEIQKTVGGCRAFLLKNRKEIKLTTTVVAILEATKEKSKYDLFKKLVRHTPKGYTSPFYVLSTISKHGDLLRKAWGI